MAKGNENHGFGEPRGVDVVGTGDPISVSIDTIFPCRSALLKRTNISRCYHGIDLNREITLEDFLEVEKE